MPKKYYEILGVSKDASATEIKAAFYELSKKHHPDVGNENTERFLDLKEAYDVLRDESSRSLYDRTFEIDPENYIGRSYSGKSTQRSRASNTRREEMQIVNDPSSRYGHFYDPGAVYEQEKANRKAAFAFLVFVFVLLGINLIYIYRLKARQKKRTQKEYVNNTSSMLPPATITMLRNDWKTACFHFVPKTSFYCFSDYYEVLGVSRTATSKEIKDAFIILSKKYHPDRVDGDSQRFLEVKEAYDVLYDHDKRQNYDAGFTFDRPSAWNSQQWSNWESARPRSDFSKGQSYQRTYQQSGRSEANFDPKEFERIFRQFTQRPRSQTRQEFEEEMKQARQRIYEEFAKNRNNRYSNSDDFTRQRVYRIRLKMLSNTTNEGNYRLTTNSNNRQVVITENDRERFQRMVNTPPIREQKEQQDPYNYPAGFPSDK
ncbi:DnaJ domain-containing protein [Aphelenchoides besseyi]|nr:DnaJ domain-containing protein [Aphelenchoides besseyi]